jgi:hypothetical protein
LAEEGDRRAQILEAAFEVFSAKGFKGRRSRASRGLRGYSPVRAIPSRIVGFGLWPVRVKVTPYRR